MSPSPAWSRTCDVVIAGSGAAGLTAAIGLVAAGLDVVVLTRGAVTDSSTDWAQGGMAAVWDPADSAALHVSDTLTAGAGLCDEEAVRTLVAEAPGALRRLIGLGARFDTGPDGRIDLHLEGGHHARRVLHAGGDRSGHEVEKTLARAADTPAGPGRLTTLAGTRLVDILTDAAGRACGVSALDESSSIGNINAQAVVLATGGIGQLWETTTNPAVATGDGLAAALRAGAVARDLEFVQFHPTLLWVQPSRRVPGDRGVLISEAVRGEGAVLVDAAGARVMEGVHPLADLAPRDVVSAAEQARMARCGTDHLFLDATGFGARRWERSFPSILAMCRARGVDPVTEPIPVAPGAHYHCGGVAASMSGTTSVPGLLALGEVACTGVQGANRLASNSVTEALVMGDRAARELASALTPGAAPSVPVQRARAEMPAADALETIRHAMTEHVSVLRSAAGLEAALDVLDHLTGHGRTSADLPAEAAGHDSPSAAAAALDLDRDVRSHQVLTSANAAIVARAIANAALTRTESRGCHRRSDAAERRDAWLTHLDVRLDTGGGLRIVRTESLTRKEAA